ncbi:hypothetical protein [Actinokineospora sp. HUAS TT18]|uniref:hypothetical protein n=1 Tax=Actinokineospora sp. HUAS TT18 TaxID=3447451 RepID=UPI003F52485F
MIGQLRRAALVVGMAVTLLVPAAVTATAATAAPAAPAAPTGEAGVLGGCWWPDICGRVVNATGRGFSATIDWPKRGTGDWWVAGWSSLGGNGIDVDGFYVGHGCWMAGYVEGLGYRYPFVEWDDDWHQIHNNETAFITQHSC